MRTNRALQLCRRWIPRVLALIGAGCGGGGGGSGAPAAAASGPAASGNAQISFTNLQTRTVFGSGAVAFNISPPPASGQQTSCTLNGSAASPCLVGASAGEIGYTNLALGLHRFNVEVRDANGASVARAERTLDVVDASIAIFGATPGGIAAAIAAAREGERVVLIEPTLWVGGMMSGGLAKTDLGPRGLEVLGGFANELFRRVRDAEIRRGVCPESRCLGLYDFEPRVAEEVFESMLAEAGIVVERPVRLQGVHKQGTTIEHLATDRGTLHADVYIDASYEGDLMALAGVTYRLGREPRVMANPPNDPAQLGLQEDHAGATQYRISRSLYVDPYRVPGERASGTLPFIEPRPATLPDSGDGDSRVMAYTYRLCVTDDPSNRVPFAPPSNYDPLHYEASARLAQLWADSGADLANEMFNPARTVHSGTSAYYKYDLNGGSTFSIDMTAPNLNQAYVEAGEAERERIRQAYRDYIRGLLYSWQTDPRYGRLNAKMAAFGYCKDEFTDRGGWPHQLYVRTARRMVGEYVINENDVLQNGRRAPIADVVGFGAYNIDMHAVRYFAGPVNWPDGVRRDAIVLEGFLVAHAPNDEPYPVPYRSLVPQAQDATNFLNPVTPSATHVAQAALRMEPTFMILGEAAGIAAALAVQSRQPVQSVDYATLRQRLLARGQVLVH
jgi:FAD dependent oxidoreductase